MYDFQTEVDTIFFDEDGNRIKNMFIPLEFYHTALRHVLYIRERYYNRLISKVDIKKYKAFLKRLKTRRVYRRMGFDGIRFGSKNRKDRK